MVNLFSTIDSLRAAFFPAEQNAVTAHDSAFDFTTLLQQAVQHEDNSNQSSPIDDDDLPLLALPFNSELPPPSSSPNLQSTLPSSDVIPPVGSKQVNNHAARGKKAARKRRREAAKASDALEYKVPRLAVKKHTASQEPIGSNVRMDSMPSASSGFVGKPEDNEEKTQTLVSLDDLFPGEGGSGFRLVSYEGISKPITDNKGRIVAHYLVNNSPGWDEKVRSGTQLLAELGPQCSPAAQHAEHRRGNFGFLSTGISQGNGSTEPHNLGNGKKNTKVLSTILAHPFFIQLSGYINSVFATWAPVLYAHYVEYMSKLQTWNPLLLRPFANSVFGSLTVNFGPWTVCFGHRDGANLPYGWCAITALGLFNWKKGGHLVLWDLKLVIEFPPGVTILIPSSVFRHRNTTIDASETRYSFAQYTSGGLFRWVDHGYQLDEDYFASLKTPEQQRRERVTRQGRWRKGLKMFSTLAELRKLYGKAPSAEWATCDIEELSDLSDVD